MDIFCQNLLMVYSTCEDAHCSERLPNCDIKKKIKRRATKRYKNELQLSHCKDFLPCKRQTPNCVRNIWRRSDSRCGSRFYVASATDEQKREGEWLTDSDGAAWIFDRRRVETASNMKRSLYTEPQPPLQLRAPALHSRLKTRALQRAQTNTTLPLKNGRFGYLTAAGCIKYETQPLHKATATASSHEKLHFITLNSVDLWCGGNYAK